MAFVLIALTLGSMLAVAATIAMWLVLGSSTLMRRSIIALLGTSLLGLAFCATIRELEAEWLVLMWIVVVTVAAMFTIIRWRGLRLVNTTKPTHIDSGEFQFSVLHLIGLTAAVALIAAVARTLTPLAATLDVLLVGLGIAVCLGSLAIIVSLTTLRQRRTKYGLPITAIATTANAGVVYMVMEATNADPGIVWGSIVVVYALSLCALLRYCFNRGFKLASRWELEAAEP